MRIQLPLEIPLIRLFIEPRKAGLAFITKGKLPLMENGPEAVGTLVLPWAIIVMLSLLVGAGAVLISFRREIANSWLISTAAPENLGVTVTVITVSAFVIGWLLTFWKKRQLFTYGIAEIVFGLFSIAGISYFLWDKPELSKFVGLGSALYVVSRGMGNFWDATVDEIKSKKIQVTVTVSSGGTALLNVSETDLIPLLDGR
jgi:hypothetical protein